MKKKIMLEHLDGEIKWLKWTILHFPLEGILWNRMISRLEELNNLKQKLESDKSV